MLATGGFRLGLVAGAVVAVVSIAAWAATGRRPLPLAGLLLVVAALLGMARAGDWPDSERLAGIDPWMWIAAVAATVIGAPLTWDLDRRFPGLAPVLVAISAAGIYLTVPDTEVSVVVLGAALPVAFTGWPWPASRLGGVGGLLAVGLLAATALVGGTARPGAVVGALGCLGLLALEPVARLLAGGHGPFDRLGRRSSLVGSVAVLHAVVVLVASRVAGLRASALDAGAILAVSGALAVALLVALSDPGDDGALGGESAERR
ncbi:hypothetical protein BH20ACT2_BH20ACT2_08670 [soil metagenome]